MQKRASQGASRKNLCQLSDLIQEVSLDKNPVVHHGNQYDTFIFKDGFTQSSYTFHKLKEQARKCHKENRPPHLYECDSPAPNNNGYKQVMNILENIKKYRNREILKKCKESKDVKCKDPCELRLQPGFSEVPRKYKMAVEYFDEANRTFFRKYLYDGTPFELKEKMVQRLRTSKISRSIDQELNDSFIDDSEDTLLGEEDERRRAEQREQLEISLQEEFRCTYLKECKEIEADIKVRFGRMSRYLIEPPPAEKSQQALVNKLLKKQIKRQQQMGLFEKEKSKHQGRLTKEIRQFGQSSSSKGINLIRDSTCKTLPINPTVDQRLMEKYFKAVRQSNIIELEFCVRAQPQLVHCRDSNGNTALHLLAKSGELDCIRFLLTRGCNPSVRNLLGRTAASIASHFDNAEASSLMNSFLTR